jgi:hypothetical protein
MVQMGKLKEGKGRARYLSDTERDALLAACKPHSPLSTSPLCWRSLQGPGKRKSWASHGLMWIWPVGLSA